jgi:hypothetical protein
MAHLVEIHPELLGQESQVAATEIPEGEKEIDPEWAFANATVGGVFEFLSSERRKAEAEAECLRIRVGVLEGKKEDLARENQALHEQSEQLRTERDLAIKEKDQVMAENRDLAKDNRLLNDQVLRIKNGAKSAAEFRETYGELQGRRS